MYDIPWGDSCPVGTLAIDNITKMPCVTVEHAGDHFYRIMLIDYTFAHRYAADMTPVYQNHPKPIIEDKDAKHRAFADSIFNINDLSNLKPIIRKRRPAPTR